MKASFIQSSVEIAIRNAPLVYLGDGDPDVMSVGYDLELFLHTLPFAQMLSQDRERLVELGWKWDPEQGVWAHAKTS